MKKNKIFTETFAQYHAKKRAIKEDLIEQSKVITEAEVSSPMVRDVHEIIKQLKVMNPSNFYVALMIYDVLGIERPSEKLIDAVAKYIRDLDTVYDEFVRDEIRTIAEELDGPAEADEVKIEDEVKVEEPVEEKLGEFKKSSKKNHKVNQDFTYKE